MIPRLSNSAREQDHHVIVVVVFISLSHYFCVSSETISRFKHLARADVKANWRWVAVETISIELESKSDLV